MVCVFLELYIISSDMRGSLLDVVPFILLVQATITPPLPEEIETMTLEQLKQTDIQLQAEARPR